MNGSFYNAIQLFPGGFESSGGVFLFRDGPEMNSSLHTPFADVRCNCSIAAAVPCRTAIQYFDFRVGSNLGGDDFLI